GGAIVAGGHPLGAGVGRGRLLGAVEVERPPAGPPVERQRGHGVEQRAGPIGRVEPGEQRVERGPGRLERRRLPLDAQQRGGGQLLPALLDRLRRHRDAWPRAGSLRAWNSDATTKLSPQVSTCSGSPAPSGPPARGGSARYEV